MWWFMRDICSFYLSAIEGFDVCMMNNIWKEREQRKIRFHLVLETLLRSFEPPVSPPYHEPSTTCQLGQDVPLVNSQDHLQLRSLCPINPNINISHLCPIKPYHMHRSSTSQPCSWSASLGTPWQHSSLGSWAPLALAGSRQSRNVW